MYYLAYTVLPIATGPVYGTAMCSNAWETRMLVHPWVLVLAWVLLQPLVLVLALALLGPLVLVLAWALPLLKLPKSRDSE